MSLIELMVSLTLAVMFFGAAVMGVGALTGVKAKSTAGELAGVIRSLYDTAALSGRTCRLVFRLPSEKEGGKTAYWAECAQGAVTAGRDRDAALQQANQAEGERAKKGSEAKNPLSSLSTQDAPTLQDMMAKEKERVENQAQFAQYTAEEVKQREIPSSVGLSVWTAHQKAPVSKGLAFLYFFPQGYTEKAMVFVRQGKNVWTLSVSSLTGKATIVSRELEVPRS